MSKQRILIADDDEVSRLILTNIFEKEYQVIQSNTVDNTLSILKDNSDFVLILLDLVMPISSGYRVLDYLEETNIIESTPVIVITGETIENSEDKAYKYKIADVMHKPFITDIVIRRSKNIIELYEHKKHLEKSIIKQKALIVEQQRKIKEHDDFLVNIMSYVLAVRNSESGEHIQRIKYLTYTILKCLTSNFSKYKLTEIQIEEITKASILHDIGKIGVPDSILLKVDRLNDDEFEAMKLHTIYGSDMIKNFRNGMEDEFYQYCYEICRHHHERWDGNGYPDKLKGDDIPISAQVVALADVYDALVNNRVYKPAYTHQEACDMILGGKCGAFSPDILQCLKLVESKLHNYNRKEYTHAKK